VEREAASCQQDEEALHGKRDDDGEKDHVFGIVEHGFGGGRKDAAVAHKPQSV
jgi:hypothetical protein